MTPHAKTAAYVAGGAALALAAIGVAVRRAPTPRNVSGHLPALRTPATAAQVIAALRAAGAGAGAPMLAAQSAEETAGWRAMWRWNAGNLQPDNASQSYQILPTSPPMRFRAFGSLGEGAAAMVAWVRRGGALAAAQAGDLDAYVAELRSGCYLGCIGKVAPDGHTISQADYDAYRAALSAWMQRLRGIA